MESRNHKHDGDDSDGLRPASSADVDPVQRPYDSSASTTVSHDNVEPARTQDMRNGGAPVGGAGRQGHVAPSSLPGSHQSNNSTTEGEGDDPAASYDVPDSWANLDEVADNGPVQNPEEDAIYKYRSLEGAREGDEEFARRASQQQSGAPEDVPDEDEPHSAEKKKWRVSRQATQLYTISYLILFSFLGTLARLGLQTLTNYAGAPVFPSVWFNFGGSLVMGFLTEDRMLFRHEWGTPTYDEQIKLARMQDEEKASGKPPNVDLAAAKKAHLAVKKTIPLYIGLATGFCGSFTSFSSFIRDIFLALSNDLPQPGSSTTTPRNGGYSFMALLAVIIITVGLSLSGLYVGAHLAIGSERITPTLPHRFTRKVIDPLAVVLAFGCWAGAIIMTAIPPHDHWRGVATFALVFAPLGTLARFYVSLWLNGRRPAFPLGTFAANIVGTAVLGMAYDLQRVPLGGVLGCQVLQGVEDGFCGCLTTVSTWVSELAALRRRHAWTYGGASVLGGLGIMVIVMGGLRWTDGFAGLQCTH